MKNDLDVVSLVILHNQLLNICEEMALVMMKTSYSTIFNEGLDFCCAILNKNGEVIAQTSLIPSMIGAIPHTMKWTIEEIGVSNFSPGDILVHNDPYRGGCHLPEHMMMMPVFFDNELFGFVANMAHVAEIGGKAVGSFASDATDIYQEGLRLPPVKLKDKDRYVQDVWKIILTNHRTPHNTWGDFHAMMGSLKMARKRVGILVDKYGVKYIKRGARKLMDYSERRMRAEIKDMPDGECHFENWLEDDGVSAEMIPVQVTVTVKGDELIADFTGSSSQVKGPVNCTWVVAASAVYIVLHCVTDPTIPRNGGLFRSVKIIALPGTVVNVRHPGPCVGGNTDSMLKLIDIMFGALSQVIPERIAACSGGSNSNYCFGGIHPDTKEYYANYSFEAPGTGATMRKDGNDVEVPRHGNCRNTPIEIFEERYPFLTLEYKMVKDSGGPGQFRGGLGASRVLKVAAPEVEMSALFDRMKIRPWGLFDGMEGTNSRLLIKRKGQKQWRTFTEEFNRPSPSKFTNAIVCEGDFIQIITPGGGGFGNPLDREVNLVLEDVKEGYVSVEAGKRDYGAVFKSEKWPIEIDYEATKAEREHRKITRRSAKES